MLKTSLAAAALLLAAPAFAEVKLGFVDLQRALNEVEEGKSAKAKLKRDYDIKQQKLDEEQEKIKKMKSEYDKMWPLMADADRRTREAELQAKFIELQKLFAELQKDLSTREGEATKKIFEKMGGIIAEIAEAEDFTFVMEKTDSGLLWAPPSLDLTNDLVRRYNDRYGADGAVKKGAGAAKPKGK
jgi:outer membrane protein